MQQQHNEILLFSMLPFLFWQKLGQVKFCCVSFPWWDLQWVTMSLCQFSFTIWEISVKMSEQMLICHVIRLLLMWHLMNESASCLCHSLSAVMQKKAVNYFSCTLCLFGNTYIVRNAESSLFTWESVVHFSWHIALSFLDFVLHLGLFSNLEQ